MFCKLLIVFVYCMYVSGSGIFHENSKITFYPDSLKTSDYFGYSVLLNTYGLIIGAPKAMNKDKAIYSGLIFNCTLQELDHQNITCGTVGITGQDHVSSRFRYFSDNFFKNDMWFGATIDALTDGKLLICAPRYTELLQDRHLLAYGACYIRKSIRDATVYPLKDKSRRAFKTDGLRKEYGEYGQNLNFYAYAQAGMSMKVVGNNQVIIGAPGILQWAGGIVHYRYSPDDNSMYFSQQTTSNPYFTKELGPDDYFGYSVDAGVFEIDGPTLFVGGAPRSQMGYGQVLVFTPAVIERESLHIMAKLQGPELGSYFGASLCCLDINGDGASDLLVGAPNYAKRDSGLPYDQGAVFVYMNRQTINSFELDPSGYVLGSGGSGARFGTTIADMGDTDGDGFRDVAIGAPWENEGSGVVYIYRGHKRGLKSSYIQRILAEGAGSFGISISKGFDVDNNNCNDLAIGAATSATAYLYRCIPTVQVHTSIKVPDAMNLPHNATGFTALFCITLPKKPLWPHVNVDFKAKITIDPEGNRAVISGDSEYNVSVSPDIERCDEQTVEVKPTADLSKPISMKFELIPDMLKNNPMIFNHHTARVSEDSELESTFLIQLLRDCGEDMICTPWLVMTLDALENPFIPGSGTKLGARLTVLNKEEPAYGAKVNISLPMIPKRVPNTCSLQDLATSCLLICNVPAPLLRDEEVVWDIELEYHFNSSTEMELKIVAELEDSLYYRNISKDSVIELVLEVTPEANFNVSGKPLPNATVAVTREKFYDAENITFVNYIEITNLGPSDWFHLEVQILFDVVSLSSPIEGCEDEGTRLDCVWSVPAKVPVPIVLPLRLDLSKYGEVLEKNTTINATTMVFLLWKDQEPRYIPRLVQEAIEITKHRNFNREDGFQLSGAWNPVVDLYRETEEVASPLHVLTLGEEFFTNTSITTTFVLEPAPPIWPLILGIVAGLILGLLLLALIVYLLYKYSGFFSRTQHERLKELQGQSVSSLNELDESAGAPSSTGATHRSGSNDSTKELLFEDSD